MAKTNRDLEILEYVIRYFDPDKGVERNHLNTNIYLIHLTKNRSARILITRSKPDMNDTHYRLIDKRLYLFFHPSEFKEFQQWLTLITNCYSKT